ncbi:uncharacterized protein LOC110862511 [Folsomia candida]|uniref:Uncharacterized protein n=1 Tax=Folsomia candida TaxID=158441 RepID=A0A226CX55_FOLCA|nr:uncharacterized protein LOC110862511 [Folsomia candida]XP_021967393.1 uncharacterized protein LOC110862511 [Folsomia candida]OXA37340.1 hypothetical protein Fcan01_27903 [Folsomia candida]
MMKFQLAFSLGIVFALQLQLSECITGNSTWDPQSHDKKNTRPLKNKNQKPRPSQTDKNLENSPLIDILNAASNGTLLRNLPDYAMPLLIQIIRPMAAQIRESATKSNQTSSSPLMDLITSIRNSTIMAAPKRRAQLQEQIQRWRNTFNFGGGITSPNSDGNESGKITSPPTTSVFGGFSSGLANLVRCNPIDRFNGACV